MARPRGGPRGRQRSAAILTLVLAVGLAGCGVTASNAPPTGIKAEGPATAHDLRVVVAGVPKTVGTTAAVSYLLAGASVLGTSPKPVVGSGAFDLRRGVGEASLQQPSGDELVVLGPAVVFSRVPKGAGAALPKGKTWLSASLTGSESVSTNFPQFDVQVEAFNPLLYLDEVAWGATAAAPLGSGSVDGTPVHGYVVTTNLTKALHGATGPSASSMSLAIRSELTSLGPAQASSGGGLSVPVLVWVDGAGRIVMLQGSPPGAGVGTTRITLSDFGITVRAKPPRISKVVDIAQLTPSGERENNGGGDADGA
ncbi:MAG TPA: hypothetical protein VK277_08615 [Acidimicrobiales bacterium]|nr:hypothetical protein [Acidimicrobiales bacterium]